MLGHGNPKASGPTLACVAAGPGAAVGRGLPGPELHVPLHHLEEWFAAGCPAGGLPHLPAWAKARGLKTLGRISPTC